MAEQFLRAWSINQIDLYAIVGQKNDLLLKKVKENRDLVKEIDALIQECGDYSLEESLKDIIKGELKESRSYEYLRALEVILESNGESLQGEITLHGRGWQDMGEIFLDWKLPLMHQLWNNLQLSFPWKSEDKVTLPTWPIYMILEKERINQLKSQLENFDPKILQEHLLPESLGGLDEEIEIFIETMLTWLNNSDKDLILLLDGQQ